MVLHGDFEPSGGRRIGAQTVFAVCRDRDPEALRRVFQRELLPDHVGVERNLVHRGCRRRAVVELQRVTGEQPGRFEVGGEAVVAIHRSAFRLRDAQLGGEVRRIGVVKVDVAVHRAEDILARQRLVEAERRGVVEAGRDKITRFGERIASRGDRDRRSGPHRTAEHQRGIFRVVGADFDRDRRRRGVESGIQRERRIRNADLRGGEHSFDRHGGIGDVRHVEVVDVVERRRVARRIRRADVQRAAAGNGAAAFAAAVDVAADRAAGEGHRGIAVDIRIIAAGIYIAADGAAGNQNGNISIRNRSRFDLIGVGQDRTAAIHTSGNRGIAGNNHSHITVLGGTRGAELGNIRREVHLFIVGETAAEYIGGDHTVSGQFHVGIAIDFSGATVCVDSIDDMLVFVGEIHVASAGNESSFIDFGGAADHQPNSIFPFRGLIGTVPGIDADDRPTKPVGVVAAGDDVGDGAAGNLHIGLANDLEGGLLLYFCSGNNTAAIDLADVGGITGNAELGFPDFHSGHRSICLTGAVDAGAFVAAVDDIPFGIIGVTVHIFNGYIGGFRNYRAAVLGAARTEDATGPDVAAFRIAIDFEVGHVDYRFAADGGRASSSRAGAGNHIAVDLGIGDGDIRACGCGALSCFRHTAADNLNFIRLRPGNRLETGEITDCHRRVSGIAVETASVDSRLNVSTVHHHTGVADTAVLAASIDVAGHRAAADFNPGRSLYGRFGGFSTETTAVDIAIDGCGVHELDGGGFFHLAAAVAAAVDISGHLCLPGDGDGRVCHGGDVAAADHLAAHNRVAGDGDGGFAGRRRRITRSIRIIADVAVAAADDGASGGILRRVDGDLTAGDGDAAVALDLPAPGAAADDRIGLNRAAVDVDAAVAVDRAGSRSHQERGIQLECIIRRIHCAEIDRRIAVDRCGTARIGSANKIRISSLFSPREGRGEEVRCNIAIDLCIAAAYQRIVDLPAGIGVVDIDQIDDDGIRSHSTGFGIDLILRRGVDLRDIRTDHGDRTDFSGDIESDCLVIARVRQCIRDRVKRILAVVGSGAVNERHLFERIAGTPRAVDITHFRAVQIGQIEVVVHHRVGIVQMNAEEGLVLIFSIGAGSGSGVVQKLVDARRESLRIDGDRAAFVNAAERQRRRVVHVNRTVIGDSSGDGRLGVLADVHRGSCINRQICRNELRGIVHRNGSTFIDRLTESELDVSANAEFRLIVKLDGRGICHSEILTDSQPGIVHLQCRVNSGSPAVCGGIDT